MLQHIPKQWILASNNTGKLQEFERLFHDANLPITITSQKELGVEDAIEDGLSFVENAIIKARHASRITGLPSIADDSGLCVPLLDGAPGIYSARYAGEHGNSQKNNAKLLKELAPLRQMHRVIDGQFVCALAMVRHANDPMPILAQGIWKGEILDAPKGDGGFGYDPIFWLPKLSKSASELTPTIKSSLSHRGQALQSLLSQLSNNYLI